jgi:hypothetical protein
MGKASRRFNVIPDQKAGEQEQAEQGKVGMAFAYFKWQQEEILLCQSIIIEGR